ncbi:MAG: ribosome small subunit-dependent GTPase A [Gammaproteobacteria bacterium]
MTTSAAGSSRYNATVISHFGNEILFLTNTGERLRGIPRQQLPPLAAGDRIYYEASDKGLAVITELAPRHGILTRRTRYQEKLVAVNIDQVLIISASKPLMKTGLIDRYLVASELAGLRGVIVFNKVDLLDAPQLQHVKEQLAIYASIGYPVYYLSAKTGEGLDKFRQSLANTTSVLVGHSAVGKSSLIKVLVPGSTPKIGGVSRANKGRHTTTHSELYPLDNDGLIIDSPGVREFGLNPVAAQKLAQGFREFHPYLGHCRFRDCSHLNEPGCAIIAAEKDGLLNSKRVESYRNLLADFNK